MTASRAVVVPFAVSGAARGLGLGLASLLHGFTAIEGQSVGLAQLVARSRENREERDGAPAEGPVETFVPPRAWRELAGTGPEALEVALVITGSFEPPFDGKGMLELVAFDAHDGSLRARVDRHLDGTRAGATIVGALVEVWDRVGGELGRVRELEELSWDALESVLRAERCVLHDPARNGPHDRLAALLHLGRAVGDAPLARFPAHRLAVVAVDSAASPAVDPKLTSAALRALERATIDAPTQLDLVEAAATLHARLGHWDAAATLATSGLDRDPARAKLYGVLADARRELGDFAGALRAVDEGLERSKDDASLRTARGVVLARQGDLSGAFRAWRLVLEREPVHPSAYLHVAAIAEGRGDLTAAQTLIDAALAAPAAHPEVLRRAIQLAMATEADGIPRASRVSTLALALVTRAPGDAWGFLVLGQARVRLGDATPAIRDFERVGLLAPASALAAEAQRETLACTDRRASLEIEAVVRAAESADAPHLDGIAARARSLAAVHGVWTAAYASGIAEKRRERWTAARVAFENAIALAPGATPARLELSALCVDQGDAPAAVLHAERAVSLEGKTPRSLTALAVALAAAGRSLEAAKAARDALALAPGEPRDPRLLSISEPPLAPSVSERPSFWKALARKMGGSGE